MADSALTQHGKSIMNQLQDGLADNVTNRTVASLITLGHAAPQLKLHMRAALNVGVSQQELLEIVIQMAIYAGVPACMNALTTYREVIEA